MDIFTGIGYAQTPGVISLIQAQISAFLFPVALIPLAPVPPSVSPNTITFRVIRVCSTTFLNIAVPSGAARPVEQTITPTGISNTFNAQLGYPITTFHVPLPGNLQTLVDELPNTPCNGLGPDIQVALAFPDVPGPGLQFLFSNGLVTPCESVIKYKGKKITIKIN